MAKTSQDGRIVVQLDPRMALEAILLTRLQRLPRHRRQEWLRGLLVQGFRAECQTLRGETAVDNGAPSTAFSRWLTGAEHKPPEPAPASPKGTVTTPPEPCTGKPFAALRKVIG